MTIKECAGNVEKQMLPFNRCGGPVQKLANPGKKYKWKSRKS